MMPTAQQGITTEQLKIMIEMNKARVGVIQQKRAAYSGMLAALPPGATLNGLQIIAGEVVTELATDPVRAILDALVAEIDLEATTLQGQIVGLERHMPGNLLLARTRLA